MNSITDIVFFGFAVLAFGWIAFGLVAAAVASANEGGILSTLMLGVVFAIGWSFLSWLGS